MAFPFASVTTGVTVRTYCPLNEKAPIWAVTVSTLLVASNDPVKVPALIAGLTGAKATGANIAVPLPAVNTVVGSTALLNVT